MDGRGSWSIRKKPKILSKLKNRWVTKNACIAIGAHTCLLLKELHRTLAQSPYKWRAEIPTLNFEHVVHPNPPNHLSREAQHHRDREASRSRAYFTSIYQIYRDTGGEDSTQCVNTHSYPPIDVKESARCPRQRVYSGLQSRAEELLCTIGTDGC